MTNYEITILNQWGHEEHKFFIQSNKSKEEIIEGYKQAIDVLRDKGYRMHVQKRTFRDELPSLQDMLEVLGETEDDEYMF